MQLHASIIVKLNSILVDTSGGKRAWFKRAYERAKQQAEDEGRSLEDVATERWGVSVRKKSHAW